MLKVRRFMKIDELDGSSMPQKSWKMGNKRLKKSVVLKKKDLDESLIINWFHWQKVSDITGNENGNVGSKKGLRISNLQTTVYEITEESH